MRFHSGLELSYTDGTAFWTKLRFSIGIDAESFKRTNRYVHVAVERRIKKRVWEEKLKEKRGIELRALKVQFDFLSGEENEPRLAQWKRGKINVC